MWSQIVQQDDPKWDWIINILVDIPFEISVQTQSVKNSRFIGQNHFEILKNVSDQASEYLLLAAQFDVWVWWHIHQRGGGEKFEPDRNTTFIWNEYGTYIGNVWNTLLQLTYGLTWCWMQTTGDQWTHPPRQSQSLEVLNGTRRKVCIRGTNPDSECEDRQVARPREVKVKGLKIQLNLSQNK